MDAYGKRSPSEKAANALCEQLYSAYAHDMRRVAYRVLHDRSLAEDVVQDVFVRLLCNRTNIPDPSGTTSRALLIRTARNRAIDYYRKGKRVSEISFEVAAPVILDKADPHADLVEGDRSRQIVGILYSRDMAEQKFLMILKYYCGLQDKEIAALLGISHDAVRTRLVRARRQMKEIWLQDG